MTLAQPQTIIIRAASFTIIWWMLSNGDTGSWLVGVPMIALTTWVSIHLLPPIKISLMGALQFVPFFLWQSLVGGLIVAKQAFQPGFQVKPDIAYYHWRLPPGISRVFMVNVVSLLPGTLCLQLSDKKLHFHVLVKTDSYIDELKMIEYRVAKLFGLELMSGNEH